MIEICSCKSMMKVLVGQYLKMGNYNDIKQREISVM